MVINFWLKENKMRIRIDFYDASKSGEIDPTAVVDTYDEDKHNWEDVRKTLDNMGEILKDQLINDYFNGADAAVVYLGFDLDCEYFEFDLIPN